MTALEQAERFWGNLIKLGTRRLIALGVTGLVVFAITGLAGYYLSRPSFQVLYTGLERQDTSEIASVLRDANIRFDVSPDGTSVMVGYGDAGRARVVLAEKGLPNSPNAGDELFDKLGSLGLTSFMQQVTRVRALEGELARSIQLMSGVHAARVHLVLPDSGSFRRRAEPPSASVVVRLDSSDSGTIAKAIRHLVAGAVPAMKVQEVTVLDTNGHLLASGDDLGDAASGQKLDLENTVSRDIQDNIRKTLTPFLGMRNFQISVATRLNTDQKQTKETVYNPDSRVERSVRVVKQTDESQNSSSPTPTSATQNVPQPNPTPGNGKQSNQDSQKRDELTNYEISSKTITTVSGGFQIEHISVAVLVNRASLIAAMGGKATAGAMDKEVADLQQLVASAAGVSKTRGDLIKLSVVDFADSGTVLEPVPGPTFTEVMLHQTGTIINGVVVVLVATLLIWFGIRPTIKAAFGPAAGAAGEEFQYMNAAAPLLTADGFEMPEPMTVPLVEGLGSFASMNEPNLIGDLTDSVKRTPLKRLEQIVEFDEEQAAAIMKLWMRQKGTA
ncbi:flagellar basal-body MS-ring/collar protein FliF [Methylovirgula sp. HY1]|uniref:flagellar basal-body MS-ring/collar protein FliF n=1 Tax=Methylovirgula sp. HY1 TaxID=2822761 RepID=UPI001C5B8135|nr:flagellar basal-body MS-ring/collar protein FliF [Methylovirgula sp. HY1]QXX74706.1 Flagellar M-ring protein [Methylovirgula sp. HY1]